MPNRAGLTVTVTLSLLLIGLAGCSSPFQVAVFHIPSGFSRLIPLTADIPVITTRLHDLGDTEATVAVSGDSIVVTGGGSLPAPSSFFVKTGLVTFRQVLCGAPAYTASTVVLQPGALPVCGEQYQTSSTNLSINTATGVPANTVPPDPSFAVYPSNTADDANQPSTDVLLPTDSTGGYQLYPRVFLGPAQMTASAIASARAVFENPEWLVDGALTHSGTLQWQKATLEDFHAYMAFDVDGLVISTALIEPIQGTYTSFGNKMEIAPNLNKTSAEQLAALLRSGPLPVPLVVP
jgi:preprotein translocase subunit SecD